MRPDPERLLPFTWLKRMAEHLNGAVLALSISGIEGRAGGMENLQVSAQFSLLWWSTNGWNLNCRQALLGCWRLRGCISPDLCARTLLGLAS